MDFDHSIETIVINTGDTLTISSAGALLFPTGTTAQRPTSPVAGMQRFNSTLNCLERYNGTSWSCVIATDSSIDDLSDVIIITPLTNQALVFNGTNWVNTAIVNSVNLTQPAAGLTLTNSGTTQTGAVTSTFALANDLGAIEALNTNGILTRTATDTWAARTITGTAGDVIITNGSGVAGNPTIDLATITQGSGGTFLKFTLDGFGRITANTAVVTADITALVDATYVNVTGDTMTGFLTLNADPTSALHAASKQYVDNAVTGLDFKNSVRVGTTANITLSGTQTIDGVAVVVGNRVLVKDQTTGADNGIYVVAAGAWTRTTDADNSGSASEVSANLYVFVEEGTTNADSGWVLSTNDPITLGTTSLTFTQFTGLGQINAGAGLTKTGNTIDVNTVSTSRIVVNADNIDLATTGISAGNFNVVNIDIYGRAVSGFLRSLTGPAAGITVSNADGVAGNPTLALANDLSALEGLGSTGIAVRSATDTWVQRTLVAPAAGFTITNPAGIAGDPTFVLANDLGAIEALNTNGILTRTATDTWAARTITAGANISVTNGDGIAGNPSIALTGTIVNSITLTQPAAGLTLTNTGVTQTGAATSTFALANDLGAIEALNTNAILVRTATDTWAARTLTAPAAGFTITNPAGTAGNPTFVLANDLSAVEGLTGTGIAVRTAADTWTTRTLVAGTNITLTNADGVAGNPTISSAVTVQDEGVAVTATPHSTLNFVGAGVVATNAGSGVATITIAGGTTTPGGVNTNVQFNDGGVFGGASTFNYIKTAPPRVDIIGTAETNQLFVGGSTTPGNAVQYIEVNTDTTGIEALRMFFNRTAATNRAYAMFEYDGTTNSPRMRLVDVDDDAPYLTFDLIGTGTLAVPQFTNSFGMRGGLATATTGFSWKVNGAEVATLDTQFLGLPSGTTAARPGTPVAGMFRYNSTLTAIEFYNGTVWNPITDSLQLYAENPSTPTANTASGTNAVTIGQGNTASATDTTALGNSANARLSGAFADASGSFTAAGDAQFIRLIMRNITTTATITSLFLDGSAATANLPNNSVWAFRILISARRTDATGGSAAYQILGKAVRDATAATTVVAGVSVTTINETNAAWAVTVIADTTNGGINVQVTGEAAKTIRWVAIVDISEVVN